MSQQVKVILSGAAGNEEAVAKRKFSVSYDVVERGLAHCTYCKKWGTVEYIEVSRIEKDVSPSAPNASEREVFVRPKSPEWSEVTRTLQTGFLHKIRVCHKPDCRTKLFEARKEAKGIKWDF